MARLPTNVNSTVNIGTASPDASPIVELTGTVFPAYGLSGNAGNQDGKSFAIVMGANQNSGANNALGPIF